MAQLKGGSTVGGALSILGALNVGGATKLYSTLTVSDTITAPRIVLTATDNLSWGGVYGAAIPTITGSSSTLYFYPGGSTSGNTMYLNATSLYTSGANLLVTSMPGASGTWAHFAVMATSWWGDGVSGSASETAGTRYATIGAVNGYAGIMMRNPYVTSYGSDAVISYGRYLGLSTNAYWVAGMVGADNFQIRRTHPTGGTITPLAIDSTGNVSIINSVSFSNSTNLTLTNVSASNAKALSINFSGNMNTNVFGIDVQHSAGGVSSAGGVFGVNVNMSGTSSLVNYAYYANSTATGNSAVGLGIDVTGAAGTNYGIRIGAISGGTINNYAIYSGTSAKSYFLGDFEVGGVLNISSATSANTIAGSLSIGAVSGVGRSILTTGTIEGKGAIRLGYNDCAGNAQTYYMTNGNYTQTTTYLRVGEAIIMFMNLASTATNSTFYVGQASTESYYVTSLNWNVQIGGKYNSTSPGYTASKGFLVFTSAASIPAYVAIFYIYRIS